MRNAERLALCILVCAAMTGCASSKYEAPENPHNTIDTGGQYFGPEEEWKEGEVTIPSYPDGADLIAFDVFGPTDKAYYVDARSISIGTDGVVRYTVLVRPPEGAENVAFEGIRCEERTWKPYAYGRRDRTWASARDPKWQPVVDQSIDDFRFTLYRAYFCPDGLPRRKAEEAIADIRRQFQAGPLDERRYP
jgi:hypothetical protein